MVMPMKDGTLKYRMRSKISYLYGEGVNLECNKSSPIDPTVKHGDWKRSTC